MTDVWAMVGELDVPTQERLADVLETRGADPRQRAMREAFLAQIRFPAKADVLEVGCGTGVLTRVLGRMAQDGAVVGVDIAASLLDKAGELAADVPNVRFQEADARSLPFADETFDIVVFDSTLSHVPGPEQAVTEAARVLRAGGMMAAFDGDYATTTVALDEHDPLQVCVDAMMASSVNDRRVMRRLPSLARTCGFTIDRTDSHGFVESGDGAYMRTIIDRGADMLCTSGTIGAELAAALKDEVVRRIGAAEFFGHIAYVSLVARKRPD